MGLLIFEKSYNNYVPSTMLKTTEPMHTLSPSLVIFKNSCFRANVKSKNWKKISAKYARKTKNLPANRLITLTITAFVLHIVWENAQTPLYAGYQSFSQHFPMCLAGALGDVVITLFVFAFMRLIKKTAAQAPRDLFTLAIIGFIIAIAIEQNALLIGKWNYAPSMPIIPWLKVGLVPVLQMTMLLPLSFYLTKIFNEKLHLG